jgi:ABC-2 type transport system ATP-binding protein
LSTSIIEVSDLTFDYPGFRALDNVSFSIGQGSVTALVGPNGAGKTTLLRCIAALEVPLSGRIRVAGIDVYESPREAHRLIGYLSDNFGLYSDLTVAQGLEYAACSQGLASGAVAEAVRVTAQRMGLQEKLQHLAKTLSRGQRQRLAIGQAIIHSPKVLLLDEPASGLDPEARGALADVFKTLQAQGMSLLVSSHILAELDAYSTHMLALNNGRVLVHHTLSQALNPGGAAGTGSALPERSLRLEFASPVQPVAEWLNTQPGVCVLRVDGHAFEISFSGDAQAQAALVAACVAAGHPLTVIMPVTENLQQSYLKSLAAERSAAAIRKDTP